MLLNMVMFKVTICDFGKMNINMTDKIEKRRAANCVYHIGASIKDLGKKWFGFSKMDRYLHQTNWWKESTGNKKKSELSMSMEELFRYYLGILLFFVSVQAYAIYGYAL